MREAKTSIIIEASIKEVWAVMTQLEKYPAWNSFIYQVAADDVAPKKGGRMMFDVQFENGTKTQSKELVTVFLPPEAASTTAQWAYQFEGFLSTIYLIRATRVQHLEVLPNGHTAYSTSEIFKGWGQAFIPLKQVQEGFERQAAALKRVCESKE